jgi:hypothetical protein
MTYTEPAMAAIVPAPAGQQYPGTAARFATADARDA